MKTDLSNALVREIVDELSALAADLGPGDSEEYVRTSLARLVAALHEHTQLAAATDRLGRSLQLLRRQRARGRRRAALRHGSANLDRMQTLVDERLRAAVGPLDPDGAGH